MKNRNHALPIILIIDDELGRSGDLRRQFCKYLLIRDVTDDETLTANDELDGDPLADAVFHSGQKVKPNNKVTPCLEQVMERVESRWPRRHRPKRQANAPTTDAEGEDGQPTDPSAEEASADFWALVFIDFDFLSGTLTGNKFKVDFDPEGRNFGLEIVRALAGEFRFEKTWTDEYQYGPVDMPICMLSRKAADEVALTTDPLGSLGYLPKPDFDEEKKFQYRRRLARTIFDYGLLTDGQEPTDLIIKPEGGRTTVIRPRAAVSEKMSGKKSAGERLIGTSLTHRRMLLAARRQVGWGKSAIGRSAPRVLILGPRGSGKEQVARYMHDLSRVGREFQAVALDSISSNLVESALFGHVRGAFTGANTDRPGVLGAAKDGTAFIDEVGNCDLETLRKLLRAVGEGTYSRVGEEGEESLPVECQLFFATNKPVMSMLGKEFPEDLFDRMTGVLSLPAIADLPGAERVALFRHFITTRPSWLSASDQFHTVSIDAITSRIAQEQWPGNVRQLRMTAERVLRRRSGRSPAVTKYDLDYELMVPARGSSEVVCNNLKTLVNWIRTFTPIDVKSGDLRVAGTELRAAGRELVKKLITAAIGLRPGKSDAGANYVGVAEELGLIYKSTRNPTNAAKQAVERFRKMFDDEEKVAGNEERGETLSDGLIVTK